MMTTLIMFEMLVIMIMVEFGNKAIGGGKPSGETIIILIMMMLMMMILMMTMMMKMMMMMMTMRMMMMMMMTMTMMFCWKTGGCGWNVDDGGIEIDLEDDTAKGTR